MAAEDWHSLYLPVREDGAQDIAQALQEALASCGYRPYDPFPGGSGPSFGWTARVRHFVAPARQGWVRVLGRPDRATLPLLAASLGGPLLYAWLEEETGGVTVWTAEGADGSAAALDAWRRADCPPETLARALAGPYPVPADSPALAVPLPPDVLALAHTVDPVQAQRLTERLTRSLFGRLGESDQATRAAARHLLRGPGWEGAAGQRLLAIMACLRIPEDWRIPAESDLLAAYQVARARQYRPDGLRLPGDDEALARVPDALDYLPVYAGRR